jgi:hypothetical protein
MTAKLLLLAALCLPVQGAWSLVNHTVKGAANGPFTTSAVSMTGADILFVSVGMYGAGTDPGTVCAISDSSGNTWHLALSHFVSGGYESQIGLFYAWNATVSASQTATVNCGSGSYAGATFSGFSGSQTSSNPKDGSGTGNHSGGGATSIQPGSVTLASGDLAVCIAGVGGSGAGIASIDSSFTIAASLNYAGAINESSGLAYLQSSGAALNPTWSVTRGNSASALIIGFKPAAHTSTSTSNQSVFAVGSPE